MRRVLIVLAVLVLGGTTLAACHGGPHLELVVTVGSDGVDAVPGDGVCEVTAGVGDCTLRAAVGEANAQHASGAQARVVITLGTDVTLAIPGIGDEANARGDLDVRGSLELRGEGHVITTEVSDRILDVHAGDVGLSQVTITGGQSSPIDFLGLVSPGDGGGILTRAGTSLRIVGSTIAGNRSSAGGVCIEFGGCGPYLADQVAGGGGVAAEGSLTVVGSTFAGNDADASGSCRYTEEPSPSGPPLSYYVCQVGYGGAILARGGLSVAASTFVGNRFEPPDLSAVPGADPDSFPGGAAIFRYAGAATVSSSTFVDNGERPGHDVWVGSSELQGSALIHTMCSTPAVDAQWNLRSTLPCPGAPVDEAGFGGGLGDHGGWTPTVVPAVGSPAVDAIPDGTPGLCDGTFPVDQLWFARPVGAGCDIGAVERQPAD